MDEEGEESLYFKVKRTIVMCYTRKELRSTGPLLEKTQGRSRSHDPRDQLKQLKMCNHHHEGLSNHWIVGRPIWFHH